MENIDNKWFDHGIKGMKYVLEKSGNNILG